MEKNVGLKLDSPSLLRRRRIVFGAIVTLLVVPALLLLFLARTPWDFVVPLSNLATVFFLWRDNVSHLR
ncbi:MAG: hypothetical protein SFU56_08150 [Capsulimonadales bacterium]|nr:hypothetical protein [Capsulimonadales bacterium]